jgi:hypothetical protein
MEFLVPLLIKTGVTVMGEGTQTVTTADFPRIRLVIMLKYSIDVKY